MEKDLVARDTKIETMRTDLDSMREKIRDLTEDGDGFTIVGALATPEWRAANNAYMGSALSWLRLRLELAANENDVTPEAVQQAEQYMQALEQGPEKPALTLLAKQFGLTRFEQQVLLLCAALELDTHVGRLCGVKQKNPELGFPTFALAMDLFAQPNWDIVSPQGKLLKWRLVDVQESTAQSLILSPLRADMRIVYLLKGINTLDTRLTTLLAPLTDSISAEPLADSQAQTADKIGIVIKPLLQQMEERPPLLQLLGIDRTSKQQVALYVCDELNLNLHGLSVEQLIIHAGDVDLLAQLWNRELRLLPAALYVELDDIVGALAPPDIATVRRFFSQIEGVCFVGSRDSVSALDRTSISFAVGKPTPAEQHRAWQALVEDERNTERQALINTDADAPDIPASLAGQFNLSLPAIHAVADQVGVVTDAKDLADRLWDACLATTRPQLDSLAQRLDAKAIWEDIVLPDEACTLLRTIVDQVRLRSQVYDEGGFRQRMNRGLGISALFTGPSGTGKTMAAEVLADELRLNLYRIDLSQVVSKYIGETEKNLRRLFDAAEDGGALLFFDEADALFGKRSEVKDSHDRYANIEINYLLQRIESYQGLAILATNRKEALDSAFLRRLRFMIDFPIPSETDRMRMWERIFPPDTEVESLDYDRLARFNLTGGNIHSIALNAAFLAAAQKPSSPVTMAHVLAAARMEHRKLDRPINEAAFQWQVSTQKEG